MNNPLSSDVICHSRNECSICLSDLTWGNQRIVACLPCGHVFHQDCWQSYTDSDRDRARRPECCVCRQAVISSGRIHIDLKKDDPLENDAYFQRILQQLASPDHQVVHEAVVALEGMLLEDAFLDTLAKSGENLGSIFSLLKRHKDDTRIVMRFAQVLFRLSGVSVEAFVRQHVSSAKGETEHVESTNITNEPRAARPRFHATTLITETGTNSYHSFTAMPQYANYSFEELRMQDYESDGHQIGSASQPFGLHSSTTNAFTAPLSASTGATRRSMVELPGSGLTRFQTTTCSNGKETEIMQSITSMPEYANYSFEELRLQDYARGYDRNTPIRGNRNSVYSYGHNDGQSDRVGASQASDEPTLVKSTTEPETNVPTFQANFGGQLASGSVVDIVGTIPLTIHSGFSLGVEPPKSEQVNSIRTRRRRMISPIPTQDVQAEPFSCGTAPTRHVPTTTSVHADARHDIETQFNGETTPTIILQQNTDSSIAQRPFRFGAAETDTERRYLGGGQAQPLSLRNAPPSGSPALLSTNDAIENICPRLASMNVAASSTCVDVQRTGQTTQESPGTLVDMPFSFSMGSAPTQPPVPRRFRRG